MIQISTQQPTAHPAACVLRIPLEPRFDLAALRVLRRLVASAGTVSRLELDFGSVKQVDPAALRLLASDLDALDRRGVRVLTSHLSEPIAAQLHRHPVLRYADGEDDLFTDPDRDAPGFVPSDR